MSFESLAPAEAARWAARTGLPVETARLAGLAATADVIRSAVSPLRELDFGDTPPVFAYRAEQEQTIASP